MRKSMIIRFFPAAAILFTGLTGPGMASAAQIAFERNQNGPTMTFSYVYESPDRRRHAIGFDLPTAVVSQSLDAFRRLDVHRLNSRNRRRRVELLRAEADALRARYPGVEISVQANSRISYRLGSKALSGRFEAERKERRRREVEALRRSFPNLKIAHDPDAGEIAVSGIRSRQLEAAVKRALSDLERRSKQADKRAKQRIEAAFGERSAALGRELDRAIAGIRRRVEAESDAYLAERLYRETDDNMVMPDYVGIARDSRGGLTTMADAWRRHLRGLPERDRLDRLLGFFQSIPYDRLESRSTGDGAGFATPLALIARNRGDCDTKSVAFAALLNQLNPEIPIVMLLLPEHALLGLGVPASSGDRTFSHEGDIYVLVEPVGPGLTEVGTIGDESRTGLSRATDVLRLF